MEGLVTRFVLLRACGSWEANLFLRDNNISIDGEVGPWFNENVASRFKSYGWNVLGP